MIKNCQFLTFKVNFLSQKLSESFQFFDVEPEIWILKVIFHNKNKFGKIRIISDIENWLWKSEIGTFQSLDLEHTLIYQKKIRWKSVIYHSIKLPFDVEVAKKILLKWYLIGEKEAQQNRKSFAETL